MDATDISFICIFIIFVFLFGFWLCLSFKKNKVEDLENGVLIIIDPGNGWYESLHKRKYGKALETELFRWHHKKKYQMGIEDELMPVAWHPSRYWDWCMDEDEKKTAEQLWT